MTTVETMKQMCDIKKRREKKNEIRFLNEGKKKKKISENARS